MPVRQSTVMNRPRPVQRSPQPKPKPAKPVSNLTQGFRSHRGESLVTWRRWAHEVADGGPTPSAAELSRVASDLGIRKPAAAFEVDVNAIGQRRKSQARIDQKLAAYAESLAPWNGDEQAVRAEIEQLKNRIQELEDLIHPMNSWGFTATLNRITRENPRVLGDVDTVLDEINRRMEGEA